jgi:hypothetical protein
VCKWFLDDGWSAFIAGNEEKLIVLDKASIRHSRRADVATIALSDTVCSSLSPSKQFAGLQGTLLLAAKRQAMHRSSVSGALR